MAPPLGFTHTLSSPSSDTWDGLHRKGLVEFNDIKVVYRASSYGEKLFDCGIAYAHVGRRYAYHGMGNKRAYGVMQLIDSIPPQTTTPVVPTIWRWLRSMVRQAI